MFVIKYKGNKNNLFVDKNHSLTHDLQQARVFKRKCNASNSLNRGGAFLSDYEILEIEPLIIKLK